MPFPKSSLNLFPFPHHVRRPDAFELWYWRRLLSIPWTARRSNQSILKEISLEYSLERLILKLKLQYFGHLMQTADSLEKILMLGKIEGRRRRETEDKMAGWPHRLNGHEFEQLREMMKDRKTRCAAEQLNNSKGGLFPNYFGEGVGVISRNWATAHFLVFDCWLWNCQGTSRCVIYLADVLQWVYTEDQGLV